MLLEDAHGEPHAYCFWPEDNVYQQLPRKYLREKPELAGVTSLDVMDRLKAAEVRYWSDPERFATQNEAINSSPEVEVIDDEPQQQQRRTLRPREGKKKSPQPPVVQRTARAKLRVREKDDTADAGTIAQLQKQLQRAQQSAESAAKRLKTELSLATKRKRGAPSWPS